MEKPKSIIEAARNLLIRPERYALFLAVLFIIVGTIAFLYEYSHFRQLVRESIRENTSTARLISTVIQEHERAVVGILQSYAYRPELIAAVKKRDAAAALKHLQGLREGADYVDVPLITDPAGTLWINYPVHPESHGKNFAHRDWYKGVVREGKPYVSAVYKRVIAEKDLAVAIAVPIRDDQGDVIAILCASQRLQTIGRIIDQAIKDEFLTVTVVDHEGNIIYNNRISYDKDAVRYPDAEIRDRALRGEKGSIEKGGGYLSFTPVAGIGWAVIVEKNRRAIFMEQQEHFIQAAVLAFVSFLLIALLTYFFRKAYLYQDTIRQALLEQKKSAEALRVSEERYRAIVDNVGIGISIIDREMRILSTNARMGEWYPNVDFNAKPVCYRAYNDPPRDGICSYCPTALTLQDGLLHESIAYAPSGDEIRNFRIISTALSDERGNVTAAIEMVEEITERVRAEEELKRHRDHLEKLVAERTEDLVRSNHDLQQFAYVASHDLQEPLRMVSSYLQLLERRYKDRLDSDANDFINFAVDGAARMQRMIQDLLSYARVQTKGNPFAPVDLEAVMEEALKNLQLAISESGAAVTHDHIPPVLADESQLLMLFQNIIGNAIKFRGAEPPKIHISAVADDKAWRFTVQDNGIGFDAKDAERIFGVFQRLHAHHDYPGTGIGLAVARRIVERHGGRIWAEGNPGRGAAIHFTLPLGI